MIFKIKIILLLLFIVLKLNGQSNNLNVHGFVFDDKTDEKLVGALICISDSGVAISNNNGYFNFKIKPGNYEFTAKLLGYSIEIKNLKIDSSQTEIELFFRLTPQPIELTQVTIFGEQFKERIKYKTYELQQGDFRKIPQFGESDALRAMQVLPGIVSINDFSTQLFIRGGNFDETLIAIDDVPVYNPYHLGSFFSMFNTDIIKTQTLFPSNYPNRYGGYLSGALNIHTKQGNKDQMKGSVSLGLLSSKGYIETPVEDGTLIFSARRTYFDLLASILSKYAFPYYFYDLFGKYTYPIDNQNLLSISSLFSKDVFEIYNSSSYINPKVKTQPNWSNKLFNLNYSHLYGENNSFEIQVYRTSSNLNGDGEAIYESAQLVKSKLLINNRINDFTGLIKINHSFKGNHIEAGIEYKNVELNYDWNIGKSELSEFGFELEESFFDYAPKHFSSKTLSSFINYFISDKIILSEYINLNIGFRGSFVSRLKKNLSSSFINFEYEINNNAVLLFSYGKYYQNLFVIKDENKVLLDPFSIYFFPKNENELPTSDNFSSSLILNNLLFGITVEFSSYFNNRSNLPSSYSQNINHYKFEDGYSTGLEVLVKKDSGTLNYWLSYNFARSIKSNKDYSYSVRSDRTHSIKFLLNYNLSESWYLTSYWTFANGLPYTPTIGKYIGGDLLDSETYQYDDRYFYWYPIVGNKNSKRTESYHRLDVGISGSFIWGSYYVKPYLQILNVYNSPNAIFYDQNIVAPKQTQRGSSVIPTIGFTVDF